MKLNKLITHNGSFHADDVFSTATIELFLEKIGETYEVIRTRDEELINSGDYVYDIGSIYDEKTNRFDHHQKGGAGSRKNGIEYASFGLVWKKFGPILTGSEKTADFIDKKLAAPVDAADNGIDLVENKYDISPYFIQTFFISMRPTWKENPADSDKMFLKCVNIAKEILSREIVQAKDAILAEQEVISVYEKSKDKRVLLLDNNYPYENVLYNYPEPLFVIYRRASDGLWAARALKENYQSFKNKKDFPQEWAGLKDEELQQITKVDDALFCHRALFLTVARSKEGACKLVELALNN